MTTSLVNEIRIRKRGLGVLSFTVLFFTRIHKKTLKKKNYLIFIKL
jgi:hypothetical protein